MDKVTLESDLEEAEAQLASSKTEYEYRMKKYLRTKQLYDKELVSDAEYDESLYLYETAKNTYAQHQASIVGIRRNLGYATITSPIDGVVISRAVEEGQTVAAGFETPTLFTIANDLTDMQVIADVDEADIGYVQEGQRVEFTVDAYPDDVFSGTVEQVRLEATTESSVVTYEVVITAYSQCHDIHYGTQRCMLCPLQGFAFRAGCRLGIRRFSFRQDGLPAAPYRTGRYPVCRGVEGLCTDMASGIFGAGSDADEHEGSGRAASCGQIHTGAPFVYYPAFEDVVYRERKGRIRQGENTGVGHLPAGTA